MTVLQAILLGLLQGLTEFLPVSSSGHLALAQRLIPGFSQPGLVFDVAVHLGTAVSVLVLEAERIACAVREGYALRLLGQIVVASAATAVVAFPLMGFAEAAFASPVLVACGLAMSGLLLLMLRRGSGGWGAGATPWSSALFVGLVQGAAVMPGLSRSGSTIVAGAASGLERRWAADFSFLLSLPAVVGAAVVEGWLHRDTIVASPRLVQLCAVGLVAAAVSGGAAIVLVRRLLRGGLLRAFAYYLLPLAALVLVVSLMGWW